MTDDGKFLFLNADDPTSPVSSSDLPLFDIDRPAEDGLNELIAILYESGLNPVTQLSGYLITEDPTYLPEGTDARPLAHQIGRDKLLATLLKVYIDEHSPAPKAD